MISMEFVSDEMCCSAQALISPFPPLEYSLLDGVGDDESISVLQEHLRRRMEERQRLNMVCIHP